MKLSEQLKQDHECGDFGKALEGYSEKAKVLEDLNKRLFSAGFSQGYGATMGDLDRVNELFEKTLSVLTPSMTTE